MLNKKENIKVINNYFNIDDLKTIQQYYLNNVFISNQKRNDIDEWKILIINDLKIINVVEPYYLKLKNICSDFFNVKLTNPGGGSGLLLGPIIKWNEGEEMLPHRDIKEYDIAALVYLNDNYEGGEIFFPEFDLEIKPKAGDLILFPGSMLHGVKKITKGNRFTMNHWYALDNNEFNNISGIIKKNNI